VNDVDNNQQGKLDGFVKAAPKWSPEGLLEHIIELIVIEDEVSLTCLFLVLIFTNIILISTKPFSIVERGPFRRILQFQRPTMKDSDIPHRTKIREEILEKAKVVEARLAQHLKVCVHINSLILAS
jgi:hypothetical protein